jgi:hypothetical protein
VVSVREKARLDRVRWGPGRRSRMHPVRLGGVCVVEASKFVVGIETGGPRPSLGMSQAATRVVGLVVPGVEAA